MNIDQVQKMSIKQMQREVAKAFARIKKTINKMDKEREETGHTNYPLRYKLSFHLDMAYKCMPLRSQLNPFNAVAWAMERAERLELEEEIIAHGYNPVELYPKEHIEFVINPLWSRLEEKLQNLYRGKSI